MASQYWMRVDTQYSIKYFILDNLLESTFDNDSRRLYWRLWEAVLIKLSRLFLMF